MSVHGKQDSGTARRTEIYREPIRREPSNDTRKDETYREPKPQGVSQNNEKK